MSKRTLIVAALIAAVVVVIGVVVALVCVLVLGSAPASDADEPAKTAEPIINTTTTAWKTTETTLPNETTEPIVPTSSEVTEATEPTEPTVPTEPTQPTEPTKPTEPSKTDTLSMNAQFPKGSYSSEIDNFEPGPESMAPLEMTTTIWNQLGVDSTNNIVEEGRETYLYIRVPASPKRSKRADANIKITAIGVRFGNSENITVIPLSLADKSGSGVILKQTLSDASKVYEVQMRMPMGVCKANENSCSLEYWTSLTISSAIAAEASQPSVLPIACGSQCGEQNRCSSSCRFCQDSQVAGANTPVTRRFDLAKNCASISFAYETYTVKDRVRVFYENTEVFNSGCVGTNGLKKTTVQYCGSSTELRVDVEPNCACTTPGSCNTQWNFQVTCPSTCELQNSPVVLTDNGRLLNDGQEVFITPQATAPSVIAEVCPSGKTMKWTFTLKPFPNYQIGHAGAIVCSNKTFSGTSSKWSLKDSIKDSNFAGGQAEFEWTVDTQKGKHSFLILGRNGLFDDVKAYIMKNSNMWYAYAVAYHDSGPSPLQLQNFDSNGYPRVSLDDGFGIMQLTNKAPTCDQIWNWQKNVLEGIKRLSSNRDSAKTYMTDERAKASKAGVKKVDDHVSAACSFVDGTSRVIEDANGMKAYNGNSCPGVSSGCWYSSWNASAVKWNFNTYNSFNFDYVNRVCSEKRNNRPVVDEQ